MLTGFKWLARFKGLRGSFFDVFGRTRERQEERALVVEYRTCIEDILINLAPQNLALAVEIARIPELIKGYGHVKDRNLTAARNKWHSLVQEFDAERLEKSAV
jgi:indolepyruvate ferredoxin oxidoreductase